ncbi:uncharacterized [Tachysurus ichikawai]
MCSRKRPDLYTLAGGHVKRNQQQVSIEGQVVWRSVNVTQHDWWDRDLFMGSRSHDVSQKKKLRDQRHHETWCISSSSKCFSSRKTPAIKLRWRARSVHGVLNWPRTQQQCFLSVYSDTSSSDCRIRALPQDRNTTPDIPNASKPAEANG